MKITILQLISTLAIAVCSAQGPAESDPFKNPDKQSKKDRPSRQIVTSFEFIDVAKADYDKWKNQQGLSANDMRKLVEAKIKAGEAVVKESSLIVSRSGSRCKAESLRTIVLPSKLKALDFDPSGPLFPVELKNEDKTGLVCEVDSVLSSDYSAVNLSFRFERSKYQEDPQTLYRSDGRVQKGDLVRPVFENQDLTQSLEVLAGNYYFTGAYQAMETSAEERKMLSFVRSDVHTVMPAKVTTNPAPANIELRFEWVRVPTKDWNSYVYSKELKNLPTDAWDEVKKWIAEGRAKSVCDLSPTGPSGQRSRAREIKAFSMPEGFQPPKVIGGNCEPSEVNDRLQSGYVTEIEPLLASVGNLIDLNFALEFVHRGPDLVSYRKKVEGQWVPAVVQANLHQSAIISSVNLDPQKSTLLGVLTPSNEDGSQKYSETQLIFVHNETFR